MKNIRIVLVEPSHPGNVGAAARAMKNMGLSSLYLVKPEYFPSAEATARAAGADDILEKAVILNTLIEAITGCEIVYGTSARDRSLPRPLLSARDSAKHIIEEGDRELAIVFGRERNGLTNEELALCHFHINIPTVKNFSSLNLSQAVQLMAYELFITQGVTPIKPEEIKTTVTADKVDGLIQHLVDTMKLVKFLNPSHPKLLIQRLRRLFMRSNLEEEEVNILRGFLKSVERMVSKND